VSAIPVPDRRSAGRRGRGRGAPNAPLHSVPSAAGLQRELVAEVNTFKAGGFDAGNGGFFDARILGVMQAWHVLVDLDQRDAIESAEQELRDTQDELDEQRRRLGHLNAELARILTQLNAHRTGQRPAEPGEEDAEE
jgi:hypothetical protein